MKPDSSPPASPLTIVQAATLGLMAWLTPFPASGADPTLAHNLCVEYEKIDSVSCEIHKTISTGGKSVKWLSRVFYQKDDRIHVENVAPAKRRVLSDGTNLYYYAEGDRRGYRKPVAELPPEWLISLHTVPGTPMDHLLKLRDIPETALEGTPAFPVRRAYQAPKVYVVLSCDGDGKLVRIEFYSASDMKTKTAEYEYGFFHKVSDTGWLPCLHKATLYLPNGDKAEEVRRVNNLEINTPITPSLFNPLPFFKEVEFTGEFDKTYTE